MNGLSEPDRPCDQPKYQTSSPLHAINHADRIPGKSEWLHLAGRRLPDWDKPVHAMANG
jgi:hypothetical protein